MDYTRNYGGLSGSATVAKGYELSESWVRQSLEQVTAAMFDGPADVQSLP